MEDFYKNLFQKLKITLQQAAVRLRRTLRKEFNQSIIRSLTPQQAAGLALAIAVQSMHLGALICLTQMVSLLKVSAWHG